MSGEGSAVPPQLMAMAERTGAPQLTAAALDQRWGPRSTWTPGRGQLWRVVRDDVTALVVLLDVQADAVTAVPATVDGASIGEDILVLADTALGVPVFAWIGLPRSLPVAVLDRPVDAVSADVVSHLVDLAAARPAHDVAVLGERAAELLDDLVLLAETPSATVGGGLPHSEEKGIDRDSLDPDALSHAAGLLGVSMPVLLDLIDGKRPHTSDQGALLRQVFGGAPVVGTVPAGLVRELAQPRWRNLVRQRWGKDVQTEDAMRRAVAHDIYALAARQTGEQEPSWPDRIRRWAQIHQLDPDADA